MKIAAPGLSILSTLGSSGYKTESGTSMASPVITGVIALIKSAYPNYTSQQVIDRLCSTADKIPGTGSWWQCGRVNAFKAVQGGGTGGGTGGIIPPDPTKSLIFKVRFQGINTQANDQIVRATLSLGYSTLFTGNVIATADEQGIYTIMIDNSQQKIAAGTYAIKIKGPSHLQGNFQNIVYSGSGAQTFDFTTQESQQMRAGDINSDNKVTIEDVSALSKYYTKFSVPVIPTDAKMVAADVNKDGFITIQDLALVAINWSE